MDTIPYKDDLYRKEGAYFNPSGEVIYTYGEHERYAADYCKGKDFDFLSSIKGGYSYESFEEYKKRTGFKGTIDDLDVFKSSKLTQKELELFKLWLESDKCCGKNLYSDFMLYLLGFDKVETVTRRMISTTSIDPHIRLFNYYLMGWNIKRLAPLKLNKQTGIFEFDSDILWTQSIEDRDAEKEINTIKSRVLSKDIHLYLK